MTESFITQNAFEGMELSFHSLVYLVKYLHPLNAVLRTWALGSQACERLFRTARAYTSRDSTMVHLTMEAFVQRMRCIVFDGVFVDLAGLSSSHAKHGKPGGLQHPDPNVRVS